MTTTASTPTASGGSTLDGAAAPAVALADVVAHPRNPRGPIDPSDAGVVELADSIRELGILEPVVLLPLHTTIAAWAALDQATIDALTLGDGRPWPDGPPPGATWVLLAGHCRAVAAGLAGLDAAPAIVRHDLATDPAAQIAAMAAENCGRTDLPPLAEGRSFAILAGQGWSQRKIATTAGCSPGHVHKRISLTHLPEPITSALAAATITVTEALEFASVEPTMAIAAWKAWHDRNNYGAGTAARAVELARREAKIEADRIASAQQLADEGTTLIDPGARWPQGSWSHRLNTATEIKRARKTGHLVAGIDSHGGIQYYTTQKPGRDSDSDAAHRAQLAEARERSKAMKARALVCTQIAQDGPPSLPTGAALVLADTLAAGLIERVSAETGALALAWLYPDPATRPTAHPYAWTGRMLRTGTWPANRRKRINIAYTIALAIDEVRARATHEPWSKLTRAHLARLQKAGYQPSAWELQQLAKTTDNEHHDDHDDDEPADNAPAAQGAAPDVGGWLLTRNIIDGWSLWRLDKAGDIDELIDSTGTDIADHEVDQAQTWAAEYLTTAGLRVLNWQSTTDQPIDAEEGWAPTLA